MCSPPAGLVDGTTTTTTTSAGDDQYGQHNNNNSMRKVMVQENSSRRRSCKKSWRQQFVKALRTHEVYHKIASPSTTHYIIFMWLLRIVGFLLSLANWFLVCFLTCFLTWCLHIIHGGFKRSRFYLLQVAAFFLQASSSSSSSMAQQQQQQLELTASQQQESSSRSRQRLTYYTSDELAAKLDISSRTATAAAAPHRNSEPTHQDHEAEEKASTIRESPLLSVVVEDKISVQENSQIKDRERLVYEYTKVVAPQVSAFQLGEIVVPIRDTRQLATFLKSKLRDTCRSQPSSDTMTATICHLILNLGLLSSSSGTAAGAAESKLDSDSAADVLNNSNRCTSSLVELSAAAGATAESQASGSDDNNNNNNCDDDDDDDKMGKNIIQHAMIYMAAAKARGRIHLVLVGYKVEGFLGSSEFRSRYNPPVTEKDKAEWQAWNCAHLRALKESSIETAQQLLSVTPVVAQVW